MNEEIFKVKHWTILHLEGYCMINVEYLNKSSKWVYGWEGNEDPAHRGKLPNPEYDPYAIPDQKPEWCEGHVSVACLNGGNMCKHFNYCDVDKKLKKKLQKARRVMERIEEEMKK